MSDKSFFNEMFGVFLHGVTVVVALHTTSYLLEKTDRHCDEIKELFSRLEKCEKNHESSNELKK